MQISCTISSWQVYGIATSVTAGEQGVYKIQVMEGLSLVTDVVNEEAENKGFDENEVVVHLLHCLVVHVGLFVVVSLHQDVNGVVDTIVQSEFIPAGTERIIIQLSAWLVEPKLLVKVIIRLP